MRITQVTEAVAATSTHSAQQSRSPRTSLRPHTHMQHIEYDHTPPDLTQLELVRSCRRGKIPPEEPRYAKKKNESCDLLSY